MSGLIPLGRIAAKGEDIFPTTAPHLDVRVMPQFGPQKGKYIDPQTARTLLQNVVVGENKTPLVQKQGDQWKWNYPITSGFGPRKAPVAGASTYHRGIDLGIDPQNIAYQGAVTYTPGKGYGTLSTTDPQGNPYDIKFLHTKPGKQASITPQVQTKAPPKQERDTRTEDILKAFMYGAGLRQPETQAQTLEDQLKGQILGSVISQALTPPDFLSSYMFKNPLMQSTNTFF
jgi:hypothetical protein